MGNEIGSRVMNDTLLPLGASSDEPMKMVIDTVAKKRFEVPLSESWAYGSDAARFVPSEINVFAGNSIIPEYVRLSSEAHNG